MAYNGSGTFLINTAGQPVVSGTVISSTTFNSLTADLATGLSTVITKDGQTTVTANIPMASFKFTGLGVGSAAGDSANLSQVQSTVTKLLASVSGADTVTATASPTLAAYAAGQMFYFVAAGDNTTSVTLNIDALGAKAVTRDGSVALAAADIKSGEVVVVVYDGTRFQVVSQLNSAGNATFANVSITSALNVGGVATFSAGSAAAPSITTTGDTNTGLFFPAADTIAFTEGGAESLRINSSGQVGIGTASPAYKLDIAENNYALRLAATTGTSRVAQFISNTSGQVSFGLESSAGGALFTGAGAYEGCIGTDVAKNFNIGTNGTVRATIDSSGNLGLGVTPSAWDSGYRALQVGTRASFVQGSSDTYVGNNWINDGTNKYIATAAASLYGQVAGAHQWLTAASGTAGNAITFTQAMTLSAAGDLGVGTTNTAPANGEGMCVGAASTVTRIDMRNSTTGDASGDGLSFYLNGNDFTIENRENGFVAFATNLTERARITAAGEFYVGQTAGSINVVGAYITGGGQGGFCASGAASILINRKVDDGVLISFRQADSEEGTISVSGTTVSYNGGHLSRYSQTTNNTRIPLLKGTVMSNLDQMAVWEKDGEPLPNEQLNCMKVSDVEGDVNVAGVFVNWDNDDDEFANDMNIAMTGDMIIRIAQGVVVQRGELLMSAGDGTAKPQGDDIIRSKTVAKVTSNHVTCTYEDGSYCVPCVLMAC